MLAPFKTAPCIHDRHGRYCSKCGVELDPPPLTFRSIATEFLAVWLQRGFRDTVVGLTFAPGHQIRHYLRENRGLLVKPVNYLIVIAAFRYWSLTLYNRAEKEIDDAVLGIDGTVPQHSAIETGIRWIYDHVYQIQFLQAALMALILRFVFFRRAGFSLPEFTIAVIYILAQSTMIQGVLALFFTPFHHVPPATLTTAAGVAYTFFALSQLLSPVTAGKMLRIAAVQVVVMATAVALLVAVFLLLESGKMPSIPPIPGA